MSAESHRGTAEHGGKEERRERRAVDRDQRGRSNEEEDEDVRPLKSAEDVAAEEIQSAFRSRRAKTAKTKELSKDPKKSERRTVSRSREAEGEALVTPLKNTEDVAAEQIRSVANRRPKTATAGTLGKDSRGKSERRTRSRTNEAEEEAPTPDEHSQRRSKDRPGREGRNRSKEVGRDHRKTEVAQKTAPGATLRTKSRGPEKRRNKSL